MTQPNSTVLAFRLLGAFSIPFIALVLVDVSRWLS